MTLRSQSKMRRALFFILVVGILISAVFIFKDDATVPPLLDTSLEEFTYTFNTVEVLQDSPSPEQSSSQYWWLNSGGELILTGEIGQTIQGSLGNFDRWRREYALNNPDDTDRGYHPQNIFRLVSKTIWDNVRVESDFKIIADNLSTSHNRNESNGLLLMSRYVDGDTLYYGGIRVDGTAVIKKKYEGKYYTLAQLKVFDGSYNASSSPNLLPHNKWMRIRMDTRTEGDSVIVSLALQKEDKSWTQLVEANDAPMRFGNTPPILGENRIGIRTDFMDVQFRNFHAEVI